MRHSPSDVALMLVMLSLAALLAVASVLEVVTGAGS